MFRFAINSLLVVAGSVAATIIVWGIVANVTH